MMLIGVTRREFERCQKIIERTAKEIFAEPKVRKPRKKRRKK